MKRLALIVVLALSSTSLLCSRDDPVASKSGRRTIARLTGSEWAPCCVVGTPVFDCTESLDRTRALQLLPVARGDCLDRVVQTIETKAPDELSAAYFVRAETKDEPVDYLRALDAAKTPFNRALAQEKLGLKNEAIRSWDEVVKAREPGWADEARKHRRRLMQPDPAERWNLTDLEEALRRRDRAVVQALVSAFPLDTMRYFEESDLLDVDTARMFAEAFTDPYPRAIVDAVEHTRDRAALEEGLRAFREARALQRNEERIRAAEAYERASLQLQRAGNPLYLGASYAVAATGNASMLPSVIAEAEKHGYDDIAGRAEALRGYFLDYESRYLEAQAAYGRALAFARGEPATTVKTLAMRSANYATLGHAREAFEDFFQALQHLPRVADLNAVHDAYGAASIAASSLEFPGIALQYQDAAVEAIERALVNAPAHAQRTPKRHLAVALRKRAEIYVVLGEDTLAETDLQQATLLAQAAAPSLRPLLQMRLKEVQGQYLLKTNPRAAVRNFDEALRLGAGQDSTYRAVLHHQRAVARRRAGQPGADADVATALRILRNEATLLLDGRTRGEFEELWPSYFARFQSMYQEMIERRIAAGDKERAFLYAEEARAFEPMDLLLRGRPIPRGFAKVESADDLRQARATLADDTVILQYLVLQDRTYTWALSRDAFELFEQNTGKRTIDRWMGEIERAVEGGQSFRTPMRAAYENLFAEPLAAFPHPRIVIVPDGPMHALPFAALESPSGKYLIDRASIAVAGSTSLYLYSLARDRELARQGDPKVLVAANPAEFPSLNLDSLPYAVEEAQQLARDYPGAKLLLGTEATTRNFVEAAKDATIIHFAGHAVANPDNPRMSMLLLAPDKDDAGDLTAEELLKQLPDLAYTRFIALSACSTASGQSVGPEGLAPLVRPLIAARVPAVVGTLWDVLDATAKELLVSLHCHHRNGDDVAVALQKAQRDMLRRNVPARQWAPFQVVGYAASPYERPAAMEETHSERICAQNSLYRPDGLHSQ